MKNKAISNPKAAALGLQHLLAMYSGSVVSTNSDWCFVAFYV
ncbi:xanthine/uracil permease [Lacticaseibacillus paracasei subsp. paracasei Lpp126]|uniref:Xanthine/uracil permease n=1 Tax=Lacticaseibacillus paracasei subsp. paracasei Lpp126 TaxID=1256206 RepID=S2QZU1_LACPA|nr:xanthine/uracil permease [Lacticaseibacillus paracasei subsp. paracasei Lpp126]